jgi:signal transduction histidine kinase
VYELLSSLAERRNLIFTIDVPHDLGAMNMDENIVRHIVYHLLSSALRSTPSGGSVSLSAERTSTRVTIITTDTALKLPQEAIDNMLGTVPLLENSPVRGYEGWEVGLALVRRYVELHEGTMEIDNGEAEGTVFRVTLPAGIVSSKSGTASAP